MVVFSLWLVMFALFTRTCVWDLSILCKNDKVCPKFSVLKLKTQFPVQVCNNRSSPSDSPLRFQNGLLHL